MPAPISFDFTARYVDALRGALKAGPPEGMTTAELGKAAKLSDALTRRALDRLVYMGEIEVGFRHTQRRGQMPRVYRLVEKPPAGISILEPS